MAQEGGGVHSFNGFPAEYPSECSMPLDTEVQFAVNVGLSPIDRHLSLGEVIKLHFNIQYGTPMSRSE